MATYDVILVRRTPQSASAPTLVAMGPIKWTSLTVTKECGGAGSIDVTATVDSLDSVTKPSLIDLRSSPCEIWCYRDAVLIHAGPLLGYRIRERSIQFAGAGLLAYLGYMVRTTAYSATAADQSAIVKALIDDYQALTYGNFGLVTSTLGATGIPRDLTLLAADLKQIDRVITDMGTSNNGFDLEADPLTRGLLIHSPRQGADLSATVIIDQRSIGDPVYSQFVGPGQLASDVAVSSSSSAGGSLVSPAANTTTRQSFGRVMMTSTFQDISAQSALDDHAQRFVDDNSSPLSATTPGLLAVPGFAYGDFNVGDIIAYQYDAGLGMQSFNLRVKTFATTLDDGEERFTVGFF